MTNPLLEQYGIHKLKELNNSPYSCLINSRIQQTPHQIEAFIAALQALKSGGIILADEVGLGKTIEAGLVIKYLIANGAKRILIAMPPPLRKQWQDELDEKFNIRSILSPSRNHWQVADKISYIALSVIPESKYSVQNRDAVGWDALINSSEPLVIIVSYDFASWFINKFSFVKWDCFVFDEAHRLRNFGNGTKMPKAIFDATRHIPKVMLTATPLQNNLRELYALSQYIDERIFINENIFNQMYVIPEDFNGLREAIAPILHRTLRKEVAEYLKFSSRDCMSIDFKLSRDEAILYQFVNEYLQRPVLYAVESKNNALVKMVLRKLLASSSFAVIETFEILKDRLKVLKKNTKAEKADVSLKAFFKMIDDDDDSSDNSADDGQEDDDIEKIERDRYRAEINSELAYIEEIIKIALKIKKNSKAEAVITALTFAFDEQRKTGYAEKALIFTESKRTQKYLVESLHDAGFDKILVFNGEMNDPDTKKLYNAWKAKNPKRVTNTPGIDLKQAIVEQFHNDAKILVATDAASEGLNLQFCDTVINYDLPWNPMKIEQRIGRCHRFGQERDVWVYNLLNTENAADKRVYEILTNKFHLFKGVFGASDEALGLLESGSNFEKKVMGIYERCKTQGEFTREFDRLEREITPARNKKNTELKHILSSVSSDEKKKNLAVFAEKLKTHFSSLEDWAKISSDKKSVVNEFLQIKDTQIEFNDVSSAHGYLFVGALSGSNNNFLQPILLLFDNNGKITGKEKKDIIRAFENIPEANFTRFQPDTSEIKIINSCYEKITSVMSENHFEKSKPIIAQNDRRVQNWIDNRQGQYKAESNDIRQKISDLRTQKNLSKYFQEKIDIQKKIDSLEKSLRKRDEDFHDEMLKIQRQAEEERMKFNRQFEIETIAIINLVVKF